MFGGFGPYWLAAEPDNIVDGMAFGASSRQTSYLVAIGLSCGGGIGGLVAIPFDMTT